MNTKFQEWWDLYIVSKDCKLRKTKWSFKEVGIIKDAMEDAFLHNLTLNKTKPVS